MMPHISNPKRFIIYFVSMNQYFYVFHMFILENIDLNAQNKLLSRKINMKLEKYYNINSNE